MFAVEPAMVREAERMTATQIQEGLIGEGMRGGDLLILSGGNPALHHLDPVLDALIVRVHVETQGTVWREWLNRCELVVVSPKPPSAWEGRPDLRGDAEPWVAGLERAAEFVERLRAPWALKVVAFDDADLDWAAAAYTRLVDNSELRRPVGSYLSAGTTQGVGPTDMVQAVVERFSWLCTEHVARDDLTGYRVGLQAHVLAWPGELAR